VSLQLFYIFQRTSKHVSFYDRFSKTKEEVQKMKRSIAMLSCVIALFVFMAACQPTPAETVVIEKDTERMVEQATEEEYGTKIETILGNTDRIELHTVSLDGRLTINVDASIEVPNADYMPILRAVPGFFTQESVSGIFNYLYPSQKPYDLSNSVPTKEDYEEDLLRLKKQLADGSYKEDGYSEEDFLSVIADMEALYDAAPEDSQSQSISDGQMVLQHSDSQSSGSDYYLLNVATDLTPNETTRYLSVRTPSAEDSANNSNFCSLSYHDAASPNYTQLGMQRIDTMTSLDEIESLIGLSYDEAESSCFDFFKAANMEGQFVIGAAFIVNDQSTGLSGTWENGKYVEETKTSAQNYAYQIFLARSENGIQELINTDPSLTGDDVSIPWGYEYICFTIDRNGIQDISWQYPTAVTDTVVEQATLKPYSEIEAIFQDMIEIEYGAMTNLFYGENGKMEVNVEDVQLCLVRVREEGGDISGLLVPAWVFYGHNVGIDAEGNKNYDHYNGSVSTWPKAPIALLTINAIDGTIIDLAKGY